MELDTTTIDPQKTYDFAHAVRSGWASRTTLQDWRKAGILKVHTHNRSWFLGQWFLDALRNRGKQGPKGNSRKAREVRSHALQSVSQPQA